MEKEGRQGEGLVGTEGMEVAERSNVGSFYFNHQSLHWEKEWGEGWREEVRERGEGKSGSEGEDEWGGMGKTLGEQSPHTTSWTCKQMA